MPTQCCAETIVYLLFLLACGSYISRHLFCSQLLHSSMWLLYVARDISSVAICPAVPNTLPNTLLDIYVIRCISVSTNHPIL